MTTIDPTVEGGEADLLPKEETEMASTAVYDPAGNRTMVQDNLLPEFLRTHPTHTLTPLSAGDIEQEGGFGTDVSAGETMLGQGTMGTDGAGPAQANTPAAILDALIGDLVTKTLAGTQFNPDQVIQMIMDGLGVDRAEALDTYSKIVQPRWVSEVGLGTFSPAAQAANLPASVVGGNVPTPVPQFAPPISTQNIPREELFAAQGAEDLQRRLLAGTFGTGLTPTGGRAARNIYSRFASQLPIMEYGQGAQAPGPAFASFLANQPDPATLTAGLEAIQAGGAQTPFFEEAFPDVESVVGAGMQPFLMGLNPRLRSRIGNIMQERALIAAAQAPETVVTPEDRMAMLGNVMNFQPPASGFLGSNP